MIDPRNTVILTAGIISDPELVANGNIAKFRIAVDYAGSEKGAGASSGYFDVVYYLKDGSEPVVVAEAVTYAGSNFQKSSDAPASTSQPSTSIPDEF